MNTTRLSPALFLAAVAMLSAAVPLFSATDSPAAKPATRPAGVGPAAVIRLSGEVDDYNRDQLRIRFDRARAAGAKTIILEIDTWGGLVTSALDISRFLKNQTDVHTIAFVNSKAISAGSMIALACDEIVMTPSATLGDCAPIQVDPSRGVVPMRAAERAKSESPILAEFRESAERNGYSTVLAEAMVQTQLSVYWIEDGNGNRQFVNEADYKALTADGKWKSVAGEPSPIDGPDTLLTVNTGRALRYGLARGTAGSADELAAERGMTIVARYQSGMGDYLVLLFGNSFVRLLLLIIFLNALFMSLKTPGHGAPEAVALLSLGMLVGIPLLTGYAEWWEVLMILAGIGLIAFEIFVFPGHLVSLIAGTLMVIAGLLLTFLGSFWTIPGGWDMPGTQSSLESGIYVLVGGLAGGLLVFNVIWRMMPRLPFLRRLMLKPVPAGAAGATNIAAPALPAIGVTDDRWPFVGTTGVAVSDLKPGGVARFPYAADVRETSVVSESGYVDAGSKIIVREVHGNRVVVRSLV